MQIKGFIETSLIDWDGKIVSVVFLPGCNFRCPFCHNHVLVKQPDLIADVPWERLESFLRGKKGWIDGITVTGGEPTIHQDLPEFLGKFKKLGLPVKLDSNGGRPEMLEKVIKEGLVDFIAMDIKAPADKYDQACGISVNMEDVRRSIALIISSGIDHEFRTTIVPRYHDADSIEKMAREIKGAKKWALQQFVPANADSEELKEEIPYTGDQLKEMTEKAKGMVERVVLRGI
jgi:pyruvate formate lyase activating enzyme